MNYQVNMNRENTDAEVTETIVRTFEYNCNLFAVFYLDFTVAMRINIHFNSSISRETIYLYKPRQRFLQLLVEYLENIPNSSYSVKSDGQDRSEKITVSITHHTNAMALHLK